MHSASFELNYSSLTDIRKTVEDWIGRYNEKRLSCFVLVTSEIITNLLKHSSPKASQCRIEFSGDADGWYLKIYDDGGCFDDFLNKLSTTESDFDELIVSGMGLGLIKTLVDRYYYTCLLSTFDASTE